MSDVWVVNASPIIALARVGRLHLLSDLCEELLVPEAVVTEILAGPASDPRGRRWRSGWDASSRLNELHAIWLGAGETAVLAVAAEKQRAAAVLDDAAARVCAKSLGIEVIGTLGVVLRAKKNAHISSATEVLESLQAAGLWLADDVVRAAIEGVGETTERGT